MRQRQIVWTMLIIITFCTNAGQSVYNVLCPSVDEVLSIEESEVSFSGIGIINI